MKMQTTIRIIKYCLYSLALISGLYATILQARSVNSDYQMEARDVMLRAATFYYNHVSDHGGYVYYYSPDLQERWGEGKAAPGTVFVQPPGTPAVGMAYLRAFTATGDSFYLQAARDAALALVYGQLESGGWTQVIYFEKPENERIGNYRNGKGGNWNNSSLDDGQTQAALEMLMSTDKALNFEDPVIHESAMYGLNALLKAQFPIGAFPQVWRGPVPPNPVLKAKFPEYDWRTEGRIKDYWNYYTLNDNLAGAVAHVLITAFEVYKDEKYLKALMKFGDFLILAQMPDPQPGWCQQYNYEMIPIWARKFEPPAITAWEAQDIIETLIRIAKFTGEKKYLEPIPHALEYYRSCLLPDGRVARYYEFGTNRPLYMDRNYELTYDDRDVPAHYGWKQSARFDEIEKHYLDVLTGDCQLPAPSLIYTEADVKRIIHDLDEEGRWISTFEGERLTGQPKFKPGFRFISSEVFIRNMDKLSDYLFSGGK